MEQKHRCIVDPLRKYFQEDDNGEWVKYLPKVLQSYNTTIRPYSTCSPREYLFGIKNNNILPGNLFSIFSSNVLFNQFQFQESFSSGQIFVFFLK